MILSALVFLAPLWFLIAFAVGFNSAWGGGAGAAEPLGDVAKVEVKVFVIWSIALMIAPSRKNAESIDEPGAPKPDAKITIEEKF